MTPFFATKCVAYAPCSLGYRVTYCAAQTKEAAEYAADRNCQAGFLAKVVQVTRSEWNAILDGDWNTYQANREG